ncbi:MAG: hypothetical protein ACK4S4_02780 [Pyrinomonadaceae bacterium]
MAHQTTTAETSRGDLGRLLSVHPIAPAYVQRAAFVAVLSFVFFLAMIVGFYVRQNIGYFVLATAFLIVYLATMFGMFSLRRSVVKVYEHGIEYRKFSAKWSDLALHEAPAGRSGAVRLDLEDAARRRRVRLPETVVGADALASAVRSRVRRVRLS